MPSPGFQIVGRTAGITPESTGRTEFTATLHPFESPDVLEYVTEAFPEYLPAITEAARPGTSQQPDELERWEAEQISTRAARMPHETARDYLLRRIYEESFSVIQNPAAQTTFRSSSGFTPGGLISHYYQYSYNGLASAQLATWAALAMPSLSEAVQLLSQEDEGQAQPDSAIRLLTYVFHLTTGEHTSPTSNMVRHYLKEPELINPKYDTIGYRLLRLLRVVPSLSQPIDDIALQGRFLPEVEQARPRAAFWQDAWHLSQTLVPNGRYTTQDTPEINQALGRLIALRTHPEMQIFYRFLSPSGYINAAQD